MSEPTIHLTEAEFRRHLGDAFTSGSHAALDAMSGLIDGLREKTTTPPTDAAEAAGGADHG